MDSLMEGSLDVATPGFGNSCCLEIELCRNKRELFENLR